MDCTWAVISRYETIKNLSASSAYFSGSPNCASWIAIAKNAVIGCIWDFESCISQNCWTILWTITRASHRYRLKANVFIPEEDYYCSNPIMKKIRRWDVGSLWNLAMQCRKEKGTTTPSPDRALRIGYDCITFPRKYVTVRCRRWPKHAVFY